MDQVKLETRVRPNIEKNRIIELVKEFYGLRVRSVEELNAYDDRNFRLICEEDFENPYVKVVEKNGYVLKITNSLDSRDPGLYEGQSEMMLHLAQHGVSCPFPVKNINGSYYSLEDFGEGEDSRNIVRLLVYCPGEILYSTRPSCELLYDVGRFSGDLSEKLRGFSHRSLKNRLFIWMLIAVPKLRDYVFAVDDERDRILVTEVIEKFEDSIIKNTDKLEMGIIHGDLNEQNLLINTNRTKIVSVIDFGDVQYSCLIFELIIVLCYMIIQVKNIEIGKYVIDGFQSVRKLTEFEKKVLRIGVCGRMSQSLILGAYAHLSNPQNDYIMTTANNGWTVLRELWTISDEEIFKIWAL